MDICYWDWDLLAQAVTKLKAVEPKFTNEQLEYLNQYYRIKKMPRPDELQLICKEWNINEFSFLLDLEDWFYGRRMAERELEQKRMLARKIAA